MTVALIVDDSAVDRRLAGGLLEAIAGLEVAYADNGRTALDRLASQPADVTVSDLQMPDMDGLELVCVMRRRFPTVPVILMTSQGSEEIAAAALRHGAASYVPKSRLAESLRDTVEQVLTLAEANRCSQRMLKCMTAARFTFRLENDPRLIEPLVCLLEESMATIGFAGAAVRLQAAVALEHALLAAMYHGNLELSTAELEDVREGLLLGRGLEPLQRRRDEPPYRDRRVMVEVELEPQSMRVRIEDQGPGFDHRAAWASTETELLSRPSGRGLALMRTLMDEIEYNEAGNQLTLVKRHAAEPLEAGV